MLVFVTMSTHILTPAQQDAYGALLHLIHTTVTTALGRKEKNPVFMPINSTSWSLPKTWHKPVDVRLYNHYSLTKDIYFKA